MFYLSFLWMVLWKLIFLGFMEGGGGSHTLFFQVNTINGRQQPEVVGGKGVRLIIYI